MATIGCKYCNWKTAVWSRTKKGKRVSGWVKLAYHIVEMHPGHEDEADRLMGDEREDHEQNT